MSSPRRSGPAAWPAALSAGALLAVVYAASAAPDVTFWDAGEFLAAFATFGIPHPPGTPLFVAIGRVWTLGAASVGVSNAPAGNLLSAACTAAAGACTAWLVARWTHSRACAVAAALCAGTMATVWANATEAEVYAASLALACAALAAGERAGARLVAPNPSRIGRGGTRATVAAAYALALAVPVHLSALVVGPAALWLACVPRGTASLADACRCLASRRAGALTAAGVLVAGVGVAHALPVVLGAAGLAACAVIPARRAAHTPVAGVTGRVGLDLEPLAIAAAVLLGLTATWILLVRARHDPWLNQGDPSTWPRLVDVVGRRQYAVAAPWPRQAPWWIQLANLGEWADWQVALALAPDAPPSWTRTPLTIAFAALGLLGSAWHRRRDSRSWMAVLLLLVAGSLGVASILNLKAGPSFGAGVLAENAPHEARERDYFFVLAWWAWGVWAGVGAVATVRRLTQPWWPRATSISAGMGVLLAALPVALNWRASSRARMPAAHAAGDYARALLANAPMRAVLIVNGDNDTYPVWHAQAALGVRRDLTVVTASLLPARWYRAELARRAGLLDAAQVTAWLGTAATLAAVGAHATRSDRPIAVDLATDDVTRRAATSESPAGAWRLRGLTLEWRTAPSEGAASNSLGPDAFVLPPSVAVAVGATTGDRPAIARAGAAAPRLEPAFLADTTGDGVVAWAYRQLACPRAALADAADPRSRRDMRSLEGACRAR